LPNVELPELDYAEPTAALTKLLEWLEDHIDMDHVAAVEDRHLNALNYR
jgi:hypothetical protein